MNEAETRAELIDPKLKECGWGVTEGARVQREYHITAGKIQTGGTRSKGLTADYVLSYKGIKLAVIEAKSADKETGEGVAQAKQYAEMLHVGFAYATNGKEIYQINMKTGNERLVRKYPTPDEMWKKTYPLTTSTASTSSATANWREKFANVPFEDRSGTWNLRYYQEIAVRNTLEAIANGKDRILLTLATGTGKTAIAFQIAWKLYHARWNLSSTGSDYIARRPRVLFLADRNILADQAYNAFSAFPEDALVRIKPNEIKKKGSVPTNGSVFFTIFQTFMSGPSAQFDKLTDGSGTYSTATAGSATSSGTTPSTASTSSATSSGNSSGTDLEGSEHITYKTFNNDAIGTGKFGDELINDKNSFKEIEEREIIGASGYVYILECSDESFYTGSTRDLKHRYESHRTGNGAVHTKNHLPVKLIYYESFDTYEKAFDREKQIQRWSREKKTALINGDIDTLIKLASSNSTKYIPEQSYNLMNSNGGYFGEYPKDYFDFIIIDECHRGGANNESNWRAIMDYFSPAVQLGLTATPRKNENVDTYEYFGKPVYVYSLKEGINDGFLTPFKLKRVKTSMDDYIYADDDIVLDGEPEEGRVYTEIEFNRIIEIKEREAKRIKIYLEEANQNEKALIFCKSQLHAALVRDIINQQVSALSTSSGTKNTNYCVRVTANDGEIGEQFLRDFQDNERTIPTILTTSHKLSTGVDARNIRNVVLMRPINSMIEFKQIIGRGTRLFDGKDFFTIYDYVDAYHHFNDPAWDGEPICEKCGKVPCDCKDTGETGPKVCKVCGQNPCICVIGDPEFCTVCGESPCVCKKKKKIKIKLADGKERQIKHFVAAMFMNSDGKPISAKEFMELMYDKMPEFFKSEKELRKIWSNPTTRKTFLAKLEDAGYGKEVLINLQKVIDAEKSDIFDVLEYISYAVEPITREKRVAQAQTRIYEGVDKKQREFLEFVLSKYIETGVEELDDEKLPTILQNKYMALQDGLQELGGVERIRGMFIDFQKYLYERDAG